MQLQRETFDGDVIVVRHSDVMVVDWSSEYAMQIAEKIFPCKGIAVLGFYLHTLLEHAVV